MTAGYHLPHHKDKPFGSAGPIPDPWLLEFIQNKCSDSATWLQDADIHQRFVDTYREWITANETNQFKGFDSFAHAVCMQGTTECFDKFYMANHQRRFRCWRGEYMYHQLTWRNFWPHNWSYLDDEPVAANDAVVISLPFSDTGDQHPQHTELLQQCDQLGVPVLLDCAYFGICRGIEFDFDHQCIQALCFSLSKTFPAAHARMGIRFTRFDDDDPGFVYQKCRYVNRMACGLGIELMQRCGADWIWTKYRQRQLELCEQLGVNPSSCVIFGIGDHTWQQYNRGGATNRLSLHQWLASTQSPI